MYEFSNLPSKDGPAIEFQVEDNRYHIKTSEGWKICDIGRQTDSQTARDICSAIRLARDTGYEQALKDIRCQLGINS